MLRRLLTNGHLDCLVDRTFGAIKKHACNHDGEALLYKRYSSRTGLGPLA